MLKQPYPTVLKPYGRALVDLARERTEILCLTGDLTRQTEVDLFQEQLPERFIHAGMAEANMISMAGALARPTWGMLPFAPDWRWLRERADTPWYPTMRLFRQVRSGEWGAVVEQVRVAFARWLDEFSHSP